MADCKRILIYKRTHEGDPSCDGCFGVADCMGRVRGYSFESVIGVGGVNAEGMAFKVSWIGIGARARPTAPSSGCRGPTMTFDHFCHFKESGVSVVKMAPALAERLYGGRARFLILDDPDAPEFHGALKILALAIKAPPSRCGGQSGDATARCHCRRKCTGPCPNKTVCPPKLICLTERTCT
jgi:hypothetical protein